MKITNDLSPTGSISLLEVEELHNELSLLVEVAVLDLPEPLHIPSAHGESQPRAQFGQHLQRRLTQSERRECDVHGRRRLLKSYLHHINRWWVLRELTNSLQAAALARSQLNLALLTNRAHAAVPVDLATNAPSCRQQVFRIHLLDSSLLGRHGLLQRTRPPSCEDRPKGLGSRSAASSSGLAEDRACERHQGHTACAWREHSRAGESTPLCSPHRVLALKS
mmetsp:Transcript_58592/g.106779  ORF Transcript_58592/g.106779 Transcript_58592/m.106779 type:complete len:222 (-) Transcript_58592:3-668(-)